MNTVKITRISALHGESPGKVDVHLSSGEMVRVPLEWDHINETDMSLTEAAHLHIEQRILAKGHSAVEWP